MPYGVYLSAAGAHAQSHRLKVLSHNIANSATPGYKPQEPVLQARFAQLIEEGQVAAGLGGVDDLGGGVTVAPSETKFDPGPLQATGNQTDFAINDSESFFVIDHAGEQRLTRAGNFLFDNAGRLVNQNGDRVLSSGGQAIEINPTLPYSVENHGRIRQAGTTWDLMLAKPKSLGDLSRVGENQFKPLAEFDLVAGADRKVSAGMLEQSAVSPTGAMMELIETSRMYEANVRMIQNQDSVMGSLISRVLQQS